MCISRRGTFKLTERSPAPRKVDAQSYWALIGRRHTLRDSPDISCGRLEGDVTLGSGMEAVVTSTCITMPLYRNLPLPSHHCPRIAFRSGNKWNVQVRVHMIFRLHDRGSDMPVLRIIGFLLREVDYRFMSEPLYTRDLYLAGFDPRNFPK